MNSLPVVFCGHKSSVGNFSVKLSRFYPSKKFPRAGLFKLIPNSIATAKDNGLSIPGVWVSFGILVPGFRLKKHKKIRL
jgi:hypothetical protein